MKKVSKIKRFLSLALIFLFSINSFAAIVSDNDGSAFVTKAEFDALKTSFAEQIDNYNTSIDGKIDGAIAAYLAGIQLSTAEEIKLDAYQNLEFPIYSCVGKESSKHTYKEAGDARFDLSLPLVELQDAAIRGRYTGSNSGSGIRIFYDHNSGYSPNGSGASCIDLQLDKVHADPVIGKYEDVTYDSVLGAWRTNGNRKGYIKVGEEFKVQDLTIKHTENDITQNAVYNIMSGNWNTKYKRFFYPVMLGSSANNLNNTSNATTCTKWYGDVNWRGVQAGWYNVDADAVTAAIKKLTDDWSGKNITVADLKKLLTDTGNPLYTTDSSYTLKNNVAKKKIDSPCGRNKIYSGSDAYVNAFPESNIWCYNPAKIGSDWKSDEYSMKGTMNCIFTINDYATYAARALTVYDPTFAIMVPALDGDTNDTTFASDAKFSIINAEKLYWTDTNGDDHKFNEGLFITKLPKNGSLQGVMKFSEGSKEKVWCAFSKKPFDGSWTTDDALTITANGVKKTNTDLLYECDTVYTFKVDNLLKNEKIYMCFKSSSGSKNPSLDRFDNLMLILEN